MSKTLVIFDFDKTIINCDCLYEQARLGLSEEEEQEIEKADSMELGIEEAVELCYQLFKSKGKTLEDVNSYIDTIKFNDGIKDLLEFFHLNENNFELIIVSSNIDYPIKRILQREKVYEYFNGIFAIPSETCEEKIIKITPLHKSNCKNCGPNGCKTYSVNQYLDKQGRDKYKNLYFICDGFNDYCLGENLSEKDVLFPKKDLTLYKRLYEKGDLKNLKCKCYTWETGFDVINAIKADISIKDKNTNTNKN